MLISPPPPTNKFLSKALDVLRSCRGTLKYTYVFAYYLKKNNECVIFEANQKDLEMATETLSEYLEGKAKDAELSALRQMVMDKTKYCEKRRHVLLEHVREVCTCSGRAHAIVSQQMLTPLPPLPRAWLGKSGTSSPRKCARRWSRRMDGDVLNITCGPHRRPWGGPASCGSGSRADILYICRNQRACAGPG